MYGSLLAAMFGFPWLGILSSEVLHEPSSVKLLPMFKQVKIGFLTTCAPSDPVLVVTCVAPDIAAALKIILDYRKKIDF